MTTTLQLKQDPWRPNESPTCPDGEFRTATQQYQQMDSELRNFNVDSTCTISWTVPVIIETNEKSFSFHNNQIIATK